MNQKQPKEESNVFAVPKNWLIGLAAACVLFVLAELTYEKHPHVKYEELFGFFAVAAIGGTAVMTALAYGLRGFLAREEDYYDDV